MEIICFGKQTACIFGDVLETHLLVVGEFLLLLFLLVKIIKSFLCILEDNFRFLFNLLLESRE